MQARSKEGVRYGISAVVEGLKIVCKGFGRRAKFGAFPRRRLRAAILDDDLL
jgi:hypothetical protein